jgi:diacylglycerol kinase family enzyme
MAAVWVLHNPLAGKPAYLRQVDAAAEALARRGVAVNLVRRDTISALRAAARAAVAAGAAAVLVAGGDGTVGTLAGELAHSATALGVLPAGTANVWAREVGLPRPGPGRPRALEHAALALLAAPVRLADLGRCNGRWFLAWSGVGLDAYVVTQFERQRQVARRVGGFGYNAVLTFLVARGWRAVDLRLRCSGPHGTHEAEGQFLMATVCNIGLHGGGLFRFTARFHLDDGVMDLWAFRGRGFADALAHTGRVLCARHAAHPGVLRLTGSRFDIYTAQPQAIHVDGEPHFSAAPVPQHLEFEVVPRCLRLLMPGPAGARLFQSETGV